MDGTDEYRFYPFFSSIRCSLSGGGGDYSERANGEWRMAKKSQRVSDSAMPPPLFPSGLDGRQGRIAPQAPIDIRLYKPVAGALPVGV